MCRKNVIVCLSLFLSRFISIVYRLYLSIGLNFLLKVKNKIMETFSLNLSDKNKNID